MCLRLLPYFQNTNGIALVAPHVSDQSWNNLCGEVTCLHTTQHHSKSLNFAVYLWVWLLISVSKNCPNLNSHCCPIHLSISLKCPPHRMAGLLPLSHWQYQQCNVMNESPPGSATPTDRHNSLITYYKISELVSEWKWVLSFIHPFRPGNHSSTSFYSP